MNDSEYKFIPSPYPPRPVPKQVIIDPTLTKEGYAADAKITGDLVRNALSRDAVDGKSIKLETINDDERLEIAGFIEAGFNKMPMKDADGNLSWVAAIDSDEFQKLKTKVCNLIKTVIPELEKEIEALEERLESCSKQIKSRLDEDEKQIAANKEAIETLQEKISTLQTTVDALKATITTLNEKVTSLENTKADKSELVVLKETLETELASEVEKLIKLIMEVKSELDTKITNLDTKLETKISEVTTDLKDLERRVDANTLAIQEANARITAEAQDLNNKISTLREELDRRLAYLENNAVTVEVQHWSEAEQLQARTNIGAIGSGDIGDLKERVEKLETDVDELKTDVEEAKQSAETAKELAITATTIAGEAKSIAADAKSTAAEAKDKAVQVESDLAAFKTTVETTYLTKTEASETYETQVHAESYYAKITELEKVKSEIGDLSEYTSKNLSIANVLGDPNYYIDQTGVTSISQNLTAIKDNLQIIDGGTTFIKWTKKDVEDEFDVIVKLNNVYLNVTKAEVAISSDDKVINLVSGSWTVSGASSTALDITTKTGTATWDTACTLQDQILNLHYKAIKNGFTNIVVTFRANLDDGQIEVIGCDNIRVL